MNPKPSWDIVLSVGTPGRKRSICVGTSATRDEPAVDNFRLQSRNPRSMDIQYFPIQVTCFSFPGDAKAESMKVKSERTCGVPLFPEFLYPDLILYPQTSLGSLMVSAGDFLLTCTLREENWAPEL